MHNIKWSDLRYVLAVANQGSAAAAARALGVNHSTVVRRVQAFEKAQGLRLFDHLASGYRLTARGEIFLDAARSIDATVNELERKLAGVQGELAGNIRITTTDALYPLLADDLPELHRGYPHVTLDLLITNLHLNLDTLDADIALRPTLNPPGHLIGRHVCDLAFAVYAADSLRVEGNFAPIDQAPWLGLNEPLSASVPGRWVSDTVPDGLIKMRCNSFISLRGLIEQGLGYGLLPCYLGDAAPDVSRVAPEPLPFRNRLWLLSHRDLLRSQRVQVCMNFFFRRLRARRPALQGDHCAP